MRASRILHKNHILHLLEASQHLYVLCQLLVLLICLLAWAISLIAGVEPLLPWFVQVWLDGEEVPGMVAEYDIGDVELCVRVSGVALGHQCPPEAVRFQAPCSVHVLPEHPLHVLHTELRIWLLFGSMRRRVCVSRPSLS